MRCSLWILLLWTSVCHAASLDFTFDMRYQALRSRDNELVETAMLSEQGEQVRWDIATRLNHAGVSAKEWAYSAEFNYFPLSWVYFNFRALHKIRFGDLSSSTTGFASLRLQGNAPSFLSYFFELGVYQRRHLVGGQSFLPCLINPSFTEWDFAFGLGIGVNVNPKWVWQVIGATIESFDVYNLNHPYAEIASVSQHTFGEIKAYARYQFLLGFGLSDSWVAGTSVSFLLR